MIRTRRMRPAFALLALALLAGCAVEGAMPPGYVATPGVAAKTEGRHFIVLNGLPEHFAPPFLGVPRTNFSALRTLIDRNTGESMQQLYVTLSYAGRVRGLDTAYDSDGQKLQVVQIGLHEIACEPGCAYVEEFAADLPPTLLWQSPRGFAVTFVARSGARTRISVDPRQIEAQRVAFVHALALLPGGAPVVAVGAAR